MCTNHTHGIHVFVALEEEETVSDLQILEQQCSLKYQYSGSDKHQIPVEVYGRNQLSFSMFLQSQKLLNIFFETGIRTCKVDFSRKLQQVFDVCQNLNTDTSSYIAENQKRKEVSELLNGEIVKLNNITHTMAQVDWLIFHFLFLPNRMKLKKDV
jgi:hypothetical protein